MGIEVLVAITALITQVVKDMVKDIIKKDKLPKRIPETLAFIVASAVVGYSFIKGKLPFEFFVYIELVIETWLLANGGKKLLSSLRPK